MDAEAILKDQLRQCQQDAGKSAHLANYYKEQAVRTQRRIRDIKECLKDLDEKDKEWVF